MKKILYSAFAMVMAAFTLVSCEDVPMPYGWPDINGGNNGNGNSEYYLNETFAAGFGAFTPVTPEGTPWKIDFQTAKATGYDNASKETTPSKGYLVSKPVDLSKSEGAFLQFEYIYRYAGKPGIENKVLITSDYTGDPATTSWTDITGSLTEGADWTTFAKYSKDIPAAFLGKDKVVVALYYACDKTSATWEVKNLIMKDGKADSATDPNAGGDTPNTGEVKGKGSADDPFNVAGVKSIQSSFDKTKEYYVSGIISKLDKFNDKYGSISYYISDDGKTDNQFYIFGGQNLNKGKFNKLEDLKVGDKVTVCGKLVIFNSTFEMSGGNYLVALNGTTSGGGESGGETGSSEGVTIDNATNTVTLTNTSVTAGTETVELLVDALGIEDKAAVSGKTFTWADGTKITLNQGDGRNSPTYYQATKGFRVYAKNTIIIESAKPIAKIVMTCDEYNGTKYVGNATATVSFDGNKATYCNDFATNSGGTQLRPQKFSITYAK
jgi:hypothetical protein